MDNDNNDIESNCDESTATLSESKSIKTITNKDAEAMLKKIYNATCLAPTYQMLLISCMIFILSTLSIVNIFIYIFMVKWHICYYGYAICATRSPSIFLTMCNRFWTNRFYKSKNARIHFMTGIVFELFNIEALYYYLNYLPSIFKNDNNSEKKVAIFKNDCRDFLLWALILQALTQIVVQGVLCSLMWYTSALQIIIFCLSICALIFAGYLYFNYDFCVGLGSNWRVSFSGFIWKVFCNILYISDVFLDWILVFQYLCEQKWTYAGLTLLFIIVPSIAITWMTSQNVTLIKPVELHPAPKCVIYSFSVVPIIQRGTNLSKMLKVKELEIQEAEKTNDELSDCYKEFIESEYVVEASNATEIYMENSMQTILQLAIVLSTKDYGVASVIKIGISVPMIALSLIVWNRQNRIYDNIFKKKPKPKPNLKPTDKLDPKKLCDIVTLAIINILTIGPRILSFGLLASVQPMCTAVWIIASWAIVITHLLFTEKVEDIRLILVQGIIYTFRPIFVFSSNTELFYYIFYMIQSISVISWYLYCVATSPYLLYILCICIAASIIGCIVHYIYMARLKKINKNKGELVIH